VNAGRVFVTIGAVELFWIVTQWPNGALAITFAAIGVLLFSPRADQAYARAVGFVVGTGLSAALAAVIAFAVFPGKEGFAAFSIAIGLVLVPAGAGVAQPWQTPMFTAMTAFFCFLLAPTNQMSYVLPHGRMFPRSQALPHQACSRCLIDPPAEPKLLFSK